MSDTLPEREDQVENEQYDQVRSEGADWLECCQGYSHAPWCSAYKEPDTRRSGEMGHRTNHEQSTSEHQPAARGGGDEWRIVPEALAIAEGDVIIIGCSSLALARRVLTEHNQHQALVAEREQMVEALKGVAIMLNTKLEKYDKEPWAQRVRAAIVNYEQRSTSE